MSFDPVREAQEVDPDFGDCWEYELEDNMFSLTRCEQEYREDEDTGPGWRKRQLATLVVWCGRHMNVEIRFEEIPIAALRQFAQWLHVYAEYMETHPIVAAATS